MSATGPGSWPPVSGPNPSQPEEGHPDDLLASYLLGALEPDEHAAVEAHVERCPTCKQELAELRRALDALPLVALPVNPPPHARVALMQRVAATAKKSVPHDLSPQSSVLSPVTARPGVWTGAAGWAVAAALAATTALSGWQWQATRSTLTAQRQQAAESEAALRRQVAALAQLDPQTMRVVTLRGAAPAATIQGRVLYDSSGTTGVAILDHLPPLPEGKVYQLWLIQGSAPVSAGTFRSDPAGAGTLVFQAPNRIGSFSGLGLTQEPAPGVAAPTGAILATGAL